MNIPGFKGSRGPWTACRDGVCSCKTIGGFDEPIAKVQVGEWGDEPGFPYGEVSEEVARSNGRLIAAAPDLLEALIEACEIIEDLSHELNSHGGMIDDETFPKGLAAIAKAIG